jgi:hypothetical protein
VLKSPATFERRRVMQATTVTLLALATVAHATAASADDCHQGDVIATTDGELAVLANATCLAGSLTITQDVTSLRALGKLTAIEGSLEVSTTKKLTSLAGLDRLARIGGSLDIGGPKRGVPLLRNIDGLGKLVEIGGDLSLRGGWIFRPGKSMVAAIDDVTGLRALARVKGSVLLHDVNAFRGLNALVEIGGGLTIENSALSDLRGFARLERIGGHVVIQGNAKLRRISGLARVKRFDGDVVIGCPNRNALLAEKTARAIEPQVNGKLVFVGADVPHDNDDPCRSN